MSITEEELEDLSEIHIEGRYSVDDKPKCRAASDDACGWTEEWPCRTRRLIDAYRALQAVVR